MPTFLFEANLGGQLGRKSILQENPEVIVASDKINRFAQFGTIRAI